MPTIFFRRHINIQFLHGNSVQYKTYGNMNKVIRVFGKKKSNLRWSRANLMTAKTYCSHVSKLIKLPIFVGRWINCRRPKKMHHFSPYNSNQSEVLHNFTTKNVRNVFSRHYLPIKNKTHFDKICQFISPIKLRLNLKLNCSVHSLNLIGNVILCVYFSLTVILITNVPTDS